MAGKSVILHPGIDLTRADRRVDLTQGEGFDGEAAGVAHNDVIQFTFGEDVEVMYVKVDASYYGDTTALAIETVPDFQQILMVVSILDTFSRILNPGVWYENQMFSTEAVAWGDGAGNGGGVGPQIDSRVFAFDPRKLSDDVVPRFQAGQSLSLHVQTGTSQSANSQLEVQMIVWLREA